MAGTFTALFLASLVLTGCASPIERWIVETRIHQGDIALQNGNAADALLAYRLALRVDPENAPARSGFVLAAADEAQVQYAHGHFDEALTTIGDGLRVDPASVRLQALKAQVDDAKLKQEIVSSNYPTYQRAGQELQLSYARIDEANALLIKSLRRFAYTYDVAELTSAIKQSYELQLELTRITNRLIAYRQLVESGAPQTVQAPSATGSLLPLP
ncbi:MAG TPA: tetratricopeptide repeat protein [Candidatus Tyrphobacter sp.]